MDRGTASSAFAALFCFVTVAAIGQDSQSAYPGGDLASQNSTENAKADLPQSTLRERAEAGDARAQYQLGNTYAREYAIDADYVDILDASIAAVER